MANKTWYFRRPTKLKDPLTENTVGSCICEIAEGFDYSQPNTDLPDNLQFHEMGLVERTNDHLDPEPDDTTQKVQNYCGIEFISGFSMVNKPQMKSNQMNNADFRERCVQYRGRNWRLSLKGKADLKTPKHLDMFWIMKELGCSAQTADRFVQAFRDLALRPKDVEAIVCGLCEINKEEIEQQAEYLDTVAGLLEDITLNDSEAVVYDDNICHALNIGSYHPDEVEDEDDEIPVGDSNPFTCKPLEYGTDSLPDSKIRFIMEQDLQGLRILKRKFYSQEDMYTGRVYKAEFHWMSYPQRQQAWQYINARQAQIEKETAVNLTKSCKEVIHWIKQFGRSGEALSMIKRFTKGGTFSFCGVEITLEKGSAEEVNHCWRTYKALK